MTVFLLVHSPPLYPATGTCVSLHFLKGLLLQNLLTTTVPSGQWLISLLVTIDLDLGFYPLFLII
jgi:hypothetical protein